MSEPVECALCHRPIRSAAARGRQIGGGCWRKLTRAQRTAIRADPTRIRAILARPVPVADDQLPLEEQESSP